ncbi:MAG: acyl-CoA dehydrogenase family protein, partial [Chloroflexi bacterium]|nr:acyl-CoA dehydrogenase family protein [Chloroflexota bacterium]
MDFRLTEEQTMLKAMVRDFAEKELEPIAARIDEESSFPAEQIKQMAKLGLAGVAFPEKYGGSGAGRMGEVIVDEELSRVCAAIDTILFASAGLVGYPLYQFSNEEQRQRFVVPIAKGEKLGCFALTEAGAGSDVAALAMTANRGNGGYTLNGTKIFITNGAEADIALVFATLDKSLRHRGIASFIFEKGTPGFSVGKHESKLGIRASSTTELIFADCFVPEANRLGNEGEGFKIALSAIDASRVS